MTNEIESLPTDQSARRTGSGVSPMWFAFAGVALVLAVYAHWRFGQFDERIDRLRGQLADVRAAQDRLGAQQDVLAARVEQARRELGEQVRELGDVPAQVGEIGQTVAELRARTEAPQRAWVRAEALYLLELAERRLRLEHDVATAIAAMESADARLANASDPAVADVRAQLAREIAALRAVVVPDVPDIIARIAALESRTAEFRVIGVPVAKARRAAPGQDDLGPLERAMNRLAQAWHDLFSYRRVEPAMSRLVTREEEALRRQHLDLLLFAARVAAMQQDRAAYAQSLASANDWLDRYFDSRDKTVAAAREELVALGAIDVDPARPEVGTAARQLRRLTGGGATAAAAPAPPAR